MPTGGVTTSTGRTMSVGRLSGSYPMATTSGHLEGPPVSGRLIHIWRVAHPVENRGLDCFLPDDEQVRSHQQGRTSPETFTAARALLRIELGDVLGIAAREVVLVRSCAQCGLTSHGKPRVSGMGRHQLDFSISYGGGFALVALAAHGRVGVDVEPITASPAVSRWCFDDGEQRQLEDLGEASRCREITRAWVRKEAVAKACGMGLSLPLNRVATTGDPSCWRTPSPGWQIHDIPMPEGLAAAVAFDDARAMPAVSTWDPSSCSIYEVLG
jgi:4'-phosphopantetheinyl transferase